MSISQHDESVMTSHRWSNRENSSSSDSSESPRSNKYLNFDDSARNSRRSSSKSDGCCTGGHELILVPVVRDRNTVCGSCSANIRVKPAQVLSYHCYECNSDACGECVTEEMMEILKEERQKAMSEIEYTDSYGTGYYRGALSANDKREGHGTMRWTGENSPLRGNVYVGYWKNDKRDGHGKFTYTDGGLYEGMWELDEKSGYGRRSFSNGFKYHGSFKNGKKDGKGIFKGVTGRWCFAVWDKDQMVGPAQFAPRVKASNVVYDD